MIFRIVAIAALIVGFIAAFHGAKPGPRDPRCDTAARYQAMGEGVTCL